MLLPDVREGVFMFLPHTFSILKNPSVLHKGVGAGQSTEGIKIVDRENCIIFPTQNFHKLQIVAFDNKESKKPPSTR